MNSMTSRIKQSCACILLLAATMVGCNANSPTANPESAIPSKVKTQAVTAKLDHSSIEKKSIEIASGGSVAGVSKALAEALAEGKNSDDEIPAGDDEVSHSIMRHPVPHTRDGANFDPTVQGAGNNPDEIVVEEIEGVIETGATENITPQEEIVVEEPEPIIINPEIKDRYVSSWSLNVRSEPTAESEVIDTKSYGRDITIDKIHVNVDDNSRWGEIAVNDNGEVGYVSMDYVTEEPLIEYIGDFYCTYYCACPKCCGRWSGYGITASGTTPVQGRTIAADSSIPFGTKLIVDGVEYVVEDRGSGINGNRLDIYMETHESCFYQENKTVPVYRELK